MKKFSRKILTFCLALTLCIGLGGIGMKAFGYKLCPNNPNGDQHEYHYSHYDKYTGKNVFVCKYCGAWIEA